MLSARSGFKTFELLKMALLGQNLWKFLIFHYIKSAFSGEIRRANGLCQVIYLLKKSTFHFIKLLRVNYKMIRVKFTKWGKISPKVIY